MRASSLVLSGFALRDDYSEASDLHISPQQLTDSNSAQHMRRLEVGVLVGSIFDRTQEAPGWVMPQTRERAN